MTEKPRTWTLERQWSDHTLVKGPELLTASGSELDIHDPVRVIELELVLDLLEGWRQNFKEVADRLESGEGMDGLGQPRMSMGEFLREHGRLK